MHRLNFLQVIVVLSSRHVSVVLYNSFWQLNSMFRILTHINSQQEWITKTLANLGLPLTDGKIYFLLANNGPLTARKIANTLKLHRQQVYRILKGLKKEVLSIHLLIAQQFFLQYFLKKPRLVSKK